MSGVPAMPLWELLSVRPGITALVGGGGKTTMLYTLARELAERGTVVCTTTTRIFPPSHLPVLDRADRETVERLRCVCVGTAAQAGKLAAPEQTMEELAALADYVLVEADGSRGLPVKAHLPHEPVIPPGVNQTVTVVGASGFARPVREAVYRPEVFCRLAGLGADAPVTPEAVAAVLEAEGLGERIFVNQVESEGLLAAAGRLAAAVSGQVFAGALRRGEWICLS